MEMHGQVYLETNKNKSPSIITEFALEAWPKMINAFLIITHQDHTLYTNLVRNNMYHTGLLYLCKMCGWCVESVIHIVSACNSILQKEYTRRH